MRRSPKTRKVAKRHQVALNDVPIDRVRYPMILVSQHVADAKDLRPRNVWPGRLHVGWNTARGLGDNLDTALHAMPKQPVVGEVLRRLAPDRFLDAVYSLKDRP